MANLGHRLARLERLLDVQQCTCEPLRVHVEPTDRPLTPEELDTASDCPVHDEPTGVTVIIACWSLRHAPPIERINRRIERLQGGTGLAPGRELRGDRADIGPARSTASVSPRSYC